MAGNSGLYKEEVLGPGWYGKLADKYGLPARRQPVRFFSQRVTDEGLAHLKPLRGLRVLDLSGTRVTSEGVAGLQSAIPDVKVDFK